MKHGQNNRRQRSRGNGRRYPNQKGGAFESSGPEVKVRGTAQQVLEKYQSLARDAYSAGDRILAEGYFQHAEHYYRILNSETEGQNRDNNRNRQSRGNRDEDFDPELSEDDEAAYDASHANGNGRNRSDGRGDDRNSHNSNDGDNRAESSDEASEQQVTADAPADTAKSENVKSDSGDVSDSRPARKPRGRRPRKAEQPEPAVDQPVAGD